jgi:ArsR family transcriptional regulator, lead/cadmium/zinc/bismuth-responsive transcriptional repressor
MTRPTPSKINGAAKARSSDAAEAEAQPSTRPKIHGHDVCGPEEHARRARLTIVNDEQLERAAAIFRAAGDISRLKLLHRLSDGEWCVTELAEAAGVGLSTVSQQLRLLRAERIVARRRAGKHIFYSLADSHVSDLIHSAIEHAAEPHSHDKHDEKADEGDGV